MSKVLIIEDEEMVARMYEKALAFDGFEVAVAVGGQEGLTKVKEFMPDLVLLDIMMPEPDGIEVLEKIKEDPDTSTIPVVVLTNLSGKNDAALAMEKGAKDFLVKSRIDVSELGKKVTSYLNEKGK